MRAADETRKIPGRYTGGIGEIYGRYGSAIAPCEQPTIQGRYAGDIGEIGGRYTGDMGEVL